MGVVAWTCLLADLGGLDVLDYWFGALASGAQQCFRPLLPGGLLSRGSCQVDD